MTVADFAEAAIHSQKPTDLGNRCTVFMNSKVKQAQKEGATIEDISAGLSYAVIKNALYKVIKIRRPEEYGAKMLAQGGTFYNEAVLRAFEKETGREILRPDIAGLMGAYGAAIIAKERALPEQRSSLVSAAELAKLRYEKSFRHCGKCANNCLLTVTEFTDGRRFISGNRCERGAGVELTDADRPLKDIPDLYRYKYKRLFSYRSLKAEEAPRGMIGVPRVLNMYENYPFWHTFLTELGFAVVLSGKSDKKLFESGMETIPSEAVCYPAKLAHGHIASLLQKGVTTIFYPAVVYERQEDDDSDNNFNCPVVSGYPEVIKNNMEDLREKQIDFLHPILTLDEKDRLDAELAKTFAKFGVSAKEVAAATAKGYAENAAFKADICAKGEEALKYLEAHDIHGVVLAGRPYHVDPEVNHGLNGIITDQGMAVLTEDSIAHLTRPERPLRVRDQWAFHTRLYAAATFVAGRDDLDLIQLTSFGCGLDAVTTDQVAEILERHNKIYTNIKIDEGDNLGAARIRVRSLKVTLDEQRRKGHHPAAATVVPPRPRAVFTKEMKAKHTLLCPQMSPIHFQFLEGAMATEGYHLEIIPEVTAADMEEGLRHVHNDACYPCILTTGQMMNALKSGKYDLDNVSVVMTQTGGQCRATNYVSFIRKALKDADMEHIPVIAISAQGIENNPGMKWTAPLLKRCLMAINFGDLLMNVDNRTRPYELVKGSVNTLYEK